MRLVYSDSGTGHKGRGTGGSTKGIVAKSCIMEISYREGEQDEQATLHYGSI